MKKKNHVRLSSSTHGAISKCTRKNFKSDGYFPGVFIVQAILIIAAAGKAGAYQPSVFTADDLERFRAPVIILGDAETGTVLASKNPDKPLPPASLAKIMTLHLSLLDVEGGILRSDSAYSIPPEGTAFAMRYGSSVFGLTENDKATILTLQRAAAILSANDAAWTLALLSSSGNADDFMARMNAESRRLGLSETIYTDPDGWSALSSTTGYDQWTLARAYIKLHPAALREIHSLKTMMYDEADELTAGVRNRRMKNTNLLLGGYPGIDGLKTGTIPSAGFHFLATAEREGTRLIALVMGIKSDVFREGLLIRAEEAAALLDLGFEHYETWRVLQPPSAETSVLHGKESVVHAVSESVPFPLTLQKGDSERIISHIDLPEFVAAPISEGDELGMVSWTLDNEIIAEMPLVAAESIERRWRLKDISLLRNIRR